MVSSKNLVERKVHFGAWRMARCLIEADSNELESLYAAVEDYVRACNVTADELLSLIVSEYSKIFCNFVRQATVQEACPIGSWPFCQMPLSGGGAVGQLC